MRRALSLPLLVLALVAAACGDDGEDLPSDTRAPVVDPPPPPTAPTSTTTTLPPVESVAGVTVGLEEVAVLEAPIAMAVIPGEDDTVFVAERVGRVSLLELATGATTPVLDIGDQTTVDNERGLLGLAVDPAGEHLYVSYTDVDGNTRIDEYGLAGDLTLAPGSKRAVFAHDQPFPNHNGGHVTFGPDGLLYLGLGDGGAAGDPLRAGQDRGQFLGSLLRIDPAGDGGSAYGVPSDNPFVGQEGARGEVWLKGVRNPWRFSFDRATGDLWIADVGQDSVEEVNWLPAGRRGLGAGRGANLGWNLMEGDQPYEGGSPPEDHTPPVFTYTHDGGGCSVTGGYRYRGTSVEDLRGAYLLADYCTGEVMALAVDDEAHVVLDDAVVAQASGPISFAEGPDAELYLLTEPGPLYRLVPG